MDTETASLIVSPLAGLIGVIVGARLNRRSALAAAQEEREWASKQQVRQRLEEAAARIDRAVMEGWADAPRGEIDTREAADALFPFQTTLLEALTRNAVLDDPEIDRRFHALNMTIGMASRARRWLRGAEVETVNLYPLEVAVRELREALTYFQRRQPPPPAAYPTSKELIRIVHKDGGNNFDAINDWLLEQGVA